MAKGERKRSLPVLMTVLLVIVTAFVIACGTGSKDEQLSAVRTLSSETVQVARSAYNLITTDRQREFVTNYQTLLDVEKAVRDVKSELGAAAQIASVTLKSRPTKLEYKAGETFDPTGMVVVAVYDDLSEITVTDYTVDKTVLAMGDSQVTISYGGSSAVVYISVSSADSTDTGNEGGSGGKKGCGCGGVATGASIPLAVFGLALTYILMRRRSNVVRGGGFRGQIGH